MKFPKITDYQVLARNIYIKAMSIIKNAHRSNIFWTFIFKVLVLCIIMSTLELLHKKDNKVVTPQALRVTSFAETENLTNPSQPAQANLDDIIKWKKQIKLIPEDSDSDTEAIEKIPENQEYQSGSVAVPSGWKMQYSTTTATNPSEQDYNWQNTEPVPASSVSYLRFYTDTVTTLRPTSQTVITKPLDQEHINKPAGMTDPKIAGTQKYGDQLFVIYEAVDVSDGTNDNNDMTINCLNMATYNPCSAEGVSFPTYMSSQSGSLLGGKMSDGITNTPKDISTPASLKSAYDDGTYGHEGYWYIPAQQGNNYGVNCIDLKNMKNCGFTTMGSSTAPNQVVGTNPTLISGFAQDGSKLYAHANSYNGDSDITNDFVKIICFDMATLTKCSGYDPSVDTQIPSLFMSEHSNSFYTTSQQLFNAGRYYFIMSYDDANSVGANNSYNFTSQPTQTVFGNRLICYDVQAKQVCGDWPSNTPSYKNADLNICPGPWYDPQCYNRYYRQTVYGVTITNSNAASNLSLLGGHGLSSGLYERANQAFFARNSDLSIKGICVFVGIADAGDSFPSGSVTTYCYNLSGVRDDSSNVKPSGITIGSWRSGPWVPAFNSYEHNGKLFSSWKLLPGINPLDPNVGSRGAMFCYDWQIQAPCQSYSTPHYWFDVNDADTKEIKYITDGDCTIGVSGLDFVWSFDTATAETPCRKIKKTVKIVPTQDLTRSFCGETQSSAKWKYLKLDKTKIYDYRYVKITIRDKNNNIVNGFNNIDLKQEENGRLDISSLEFGGDTSELTIEMNAELLNTSPYAVDPNTSEMNKPFLTAVMEGSNTNGNANYCYQTKIKKYCDIAKVSTQTSILSNIGEDILQSTSQKEQNVYQPPQEQCFKDLKISVSADKQSVKRGDLLTYTISVFNQANHNLQNRGNIQGASIQVDIPDNTSLYSSGGGTVSDGKIVWDNQSFEPQETTTKAVTFKINNATTTFDDNSSTTTQAFMLTPHAHAEGGSNIWLRAQVVYGDDTNQADNEIDFNQVAVAENENSGNSDASNNNQNANQPPVLEEGQNQIDNNSVPEDPPNNTNTPKPIKRNKIQEIVGSIAEITKFITRPIPVRVAKPLPFFVIGVLLILSAIFGYETYMLAKLKGKLGRLYKSYVKTEGLRKDYLALISHYLNTPLSLMKNSFDVVNNGGEVAQTIGVKISGILDSLTRQIASLIDESYTLLEAEKNNSITPPTELLAKTKSFKFWVIIPVVLTFAIAILVNALFILGGKYDMSSSNFGFQIVFYFLSTTALIFAFRVYKNQKFTALAISNELNSKDTLLYSQEVFIEKIGKSLETEIAELEYLATPIKSTSKGEVFMKGLGSLKNITERMMQINHVTDFKGSSLLDTAKIDGIIKSIISYYQSDIDGKNIKLTYAIKDSVKIRINEEGLKQIVRSLLDNAIKFSNAGGEIKIDVNMSGARNTKIIIIDNGKGIARERLDSLMTPFSRGTDVMQFDYDGLGIDLYTDKLITDHNDGNIKIDSTENHGTQVTVTLPNTTSPH